MSRDSFDEDSFSTQFQSSLNFDISDKESTTVFYKHTKSEQIDVPKDELEHGKEQALLESAGSSVLTNDPTLEEFNNLLYKLTVKHNHLKLAQFEEREKTLVVVSAHSGKHKFNRGWVTKAYLNSIFEKPERLLATAIGISAAVNQYPDKYTIWQSTDRKSLYQPHVTNIHGKDWCDTIHKLCDESKTKLSDNEIEVPEDWNSGDIYLTPETIIALEGVLGTIEMTIDKMYGEDGYRLAFMAIRPPGHHCHFNIPSGFCLINNVQIAIEYAALKHGVTHAVILDIDLHHGDGSQDICFQRAGFKSDFDSSDNSDEKKEAGFPKVGYFSMHDVESFPTESGFASKENIKNASLCIMNHDLNIWNIHLSKWESEEEFYKSYKSKHMKLLDQAELFLKVAAATSATFRPAIFISAGFDASEYENSKMQRHGKNVPTSFYFNFTRETLALSKKFETHNIKVISLLEGGYSDGALVSGVFSHLSALQGDIFETDLKWDPSNGDKTLINRLVRGCKKKWKKPKNSVHTKNFNVDEVIEIGRALIPDLLNEILDKETSSTRDDEASDVSVEFGIKTRSKTRSGYGNGSKNPIDSDN